MFYRCKNKEFYVSVVIKIIIFVCLGQFSFSIIMSTMDLDQELHLYNRDFYKNNVTNEILNL